MLNELFISGQWLNAQGPSHERRDPALHDITWQGHLATPAQVDQAIAAARAAALAWSRLPIESRLAYLEAFARQVESQRPALALAISREAGKPLWESNTEVDAMIGKIALTKQALAERRSPSSTQSAGITLATRFKPHGVLGVIGPFNFPGHVPNGHIVPALLAGNTIVFKPSELTPLVAQLTMQCWQSANLPPGVINMVQGDRTAGIALAANPDIDGILFTGSRAAGVALSHAFATHPEKILALELGGNNPLVLSGAKDLHAAAYAIIQSAFITAGQRCTCARRLIVPENEVEPLLQNLLPMMQKILIGPHTRKPEPFIGPVITALAANSILCSQDSLKNLGGQILTPVQTAGGDAFLSPGLIDVTNIPNRPDDEIFGPLLQLIRVKDFPAALAQANNTKFGLAAGLLSDDRAKFEQFYDTLRAGIIHWNRPTTGASGALAFGGTGHSGNHRPSGFFAVDYCADPIAIIEVPTLVTPAKISPGITL